MNELDFDLTDDNSYRIVRQEADNLLAGGYIASGTAGTSGKSLARFLADSRTLMEEHKNKPLRIAVLMNLVHEQNRLRPSSAENPNGENSLENKLKQLKWLFNGTQSEVSLIYVSGGCPWGSDGVLDSQIERLSAKNVHHLLIEDSDFEDSYLKNRKGGEVIFGMQSILQTPGYPDLGHFDCMLFTDADMTFDLGQMGFLIDSFYKGQDVICGNRMDTNSILVKNMTRAGTGVLMFRHLQRKLAPLFFLDMELHDTQCPWKFLSRRAMEAITADLDSMDWSIDTDILASAYKHNFSIQTIAVSAIDSELESHGKALGHYVRNRTIIEGTLHQAEKYGLPHDREIAALVRKYLKTDDDYRALLESGIPETLADLPNREWGISPRITPEIVKDWLEDITGYVRKPVR